MVYLTAQLDKGYGGIKNWKDLAAAFNVPRELIIRLGQPRESPTKHFLEYLAEKKPYLTLIDFKSALKEINRMDIVAIIDNYFDTSKGNYGGLCTLDMTG